MLDAGIDVMSTVNIQHIESLNDVVEQITGIPQRETIPDAVLRGADQIEVVDLAPQALRDRLSAGLVYPADPDRRRAVELLPARQPDRAARARAALARRRGRQRAAAATAPSTASTAPGRRASASSSRSPAARRARRCCAAARGSPRARPAASCSPCTSPARTACARPDPGALAAQRALVEQLGGSYHQVVGERHPDARSSSSPAASNATQLVIGVSPAQPACRAAHRAGDRRDVIRASGDIDVHIVSHAAAGRPVALPAAARRAVGAAPPVSASRSRWSAARC